MFVFDTIACLTLTLRWQAEVYAKVKDLFKNAPDLSAAFSDFLPGKRSMEAADRDRKKDRDAGRTSGSQVSV